MLQKGSGRLTDKECRSDPICAFGSLQPASIPMCISTEDTKHLMHHQAVGQQPLLVALASFIVHNGKTLLDSIFALGAA